MSIEISHRIFQSPCLVYTDIAAWILMAVFFFCTSLTIMKFKKIYDWRDVLALGINLTHVYPRANADQGIIT
jgi:hypothetical protein